MVLTIVYAAVAFLFGIALGERGELGFVQHVFTTVIPVATIVLAYLSRGARVHVALTGAAMLTGLLLGQASFRRAWDECQEKGPVVRGAIENYRALNDGYPARLEELFEDVPCGCILRGTILHYLSNERNFRLWISNEKSTIHFTASGRSSGRSPTTPAPTR